MVDPETGERYQPFGPQDYEKGYYDWPGKGVQNPFFTGPVDPKTGLRTEFMGTEDEEGRTVEPPDSYFAPIAGGFFLMCPEFPSKFTKKELFDCDKDPKTGELKKVYIPAFVGCEPSPVREELLNPDRNEEGESPREKGQSSRK